MTCYYRLISYGRPTSSDGSGAGPLIDGAASPTSGAVGGVVSVLVAPTVIVLLFATSWRRVPA
jgi:hypothetical protein